MQHLACHYCMHRRAADHFHNKIKELEERLGEINRLAYSKDQALDAELRAIYAALPHYKEALQLELQKRGRRKGAAR